MDIEDIKKNLYNVFYTIQGEGRYTGVPTLFFRFNACNLDCKYCDTDYNGSHIDDDGKLSDIIKDYINTYPIVHICFTGGEPLLFVNDICRILRFLSSIQFYNYCIKIETNGTISIDIPIYDKVIYTITPKLHCIEKYDDVAKKWKRESFQNRELIFKFMIDVKNLRNDLDDIYKFIMRFKIYDFPIYLAPINENNNKEDIIKNYKLLFKYMAQLGDHDLYHIVNISGISIQLNKVMDWL